MKHRVGIDLGGTNIVCGLVNEHNKVVDEIKKSTDVHLGSEGVLRRIADTVIELIERNGLSLSAIEAVGAGIPGLINPIEGICMGASNLRWRNVKVAESLAEMLNIPVFIDNDVRMYVLGEALFGAGKEHQAVLGVTLGTGIAAGLLVNGRPFYGSKFIAGELGHIHMQGETAQCGCGMFGCLETVASATGLARQAKQLLAEGRASLLTQLVPDTQSITAAHISEAYDQGDAVAIEIMHHSGRILGRALSYAVTLYNPDVIVVGGGASNAGDRILAAAREELKSKVLRMYVDDLEIKLAELGDSAGVIGSAANASWMLGQGEVRS